MPLDPETEMLVHRKGPREIDPMSGVEPFGPDSLRMFDPWSIRLAKNFFGNAPTDLGYAQSLGIIPPTQSLYLPLAFKITVEGSNFDRYFVRRPERRDWRKQLVDDVRAVNGFKEDVEIVTYDGTSLQKIPLEVAYRDQGELGFVAKKLAAIPEPYEHSNKAYEEPANHHTGSTDDITSSGHRLIDDVLNHAKDHATVNKIPLTAVLGTPQVLQKFIFSALADPSIQKILVEANLTTGTLSVLVGKIGEAIAQSALETQLEHGLQPQNMGCPYCNGTKAAPQQENYYYDDSRPMGCPYCSRSAQGLMADDQRIGSKYRHKHDSSSDSELDSDDDQYVIDSSSDGESDDGKTLVPIQGRGSQLTDDRTLAIVGRRMKSGFHGFLLSFAQSCNTAKSTLKHSAIHFDGLGSGSSVFNPKHSSEDDSSESSGDEDSIYPREYRPRVWKKVDLSLENISSRAKSQNRRKVHYSSDDEDDREKGRFSAGLLVAGNSRVKTHLNPNKIGVNWIQDLGENHSCSNFINLLERHPHAADILESLSNRKEHLILFVMSNRRMTEVLAKNMVSGCNQDSMESFIKQYMVNTSKNPEQVLKDNSPYSLSSIDGHEFKITSTIGGKLVVTPKYPASKILGFGTTGKGKKKIYLAVF